MFRISTQKSLPLPLILLLAGLLLLPGCRFDREMVVKENFRRVKCETNRYLVKNLCEDEEVYLDWAAKYKPHLKFSEVDTKLLREIVHTTEDVDKAAALFYERAIKVPENRRFANYVIKKEKQFAKNRPDFSAENIKLLLVPGMFFQDNSEVESSGQSLRIVARSIGLESEIFQIDQTGPVIENARLICELLEKQPKNKRFIIASVSKGSSDFKLALRECPDSEGMKRIIGWLNIGGINHGTTLIDIVQNNWRFRLETRIYFFFKGYSWEGLLSLSKDPENPLNHHVTIPPSITTVNVVGVPLFRHVTQRARPFYEFLIQYGPSDGVNLLSEAVMPGSITYPIWRNDHYFRWPIPEENIIATLNYIIKGGKVNEKVAAK